MNTLRALLVALFVGIVGYTLVSAGEIVDEWDVLALGERRARVAGA